MSLRFEGVAHPPPNPRGRDDESDLNAAEIASTNMGFTIDGGTDVLYEHDPSVRVGTVHASWESPVDGALRVVGVVNEPSAAQAVRRGSLRGLSLGTGVTSASDGTTFLRRQEELSLCEEPRRKGCWVTHVDGRPVHGMHRFSCKSSTSSLSAQSAFLALTTLCHNANTPRWPAHNER